MVELINRNVRSTVKKLLVAFDLLSSIKLLCEHENLIFYQ